MKKLHEQVLIESLDERVASSRNRSNPRGVKRKMSSYPRRRRSEGRSQPVDIQNAVEILK